MSGHTVDYFWAPFLFTELAHILGQLFSTVKAMHVLIGKNKLGYILGDSFTNSSGHPVSRLYCFTTKSIDLH
jgi:hypothetical protein